MLARKKNAILTANIYNSENETNLKFARHIWIPEWNSHWYAKKLNYPTRYFETVGKKRGRGGVNYN